MAEFSAEVFQNEFLSDGGTDVHAIVSVTCTGAGTVANRSSASRSHVEIAVPPLAAMVEMARLASARAPGSIATIGTRAFG